MPDEFTKQSSKLIKLSNETQNVITPTRWSNQYLQAATSVNTRKAYQNDIAHFVAWDGLLPTSPDVMIR